MLKGWALVLLQWQLRHKVREQKAVSTCSGTAPVRPAHFPPRAPLVHSRLQPPRPCLHAVAPDEVLQQQKPEGYTTRGFTGTGTGIGMGMGTDGCMGVGVGVGMSMAAAQAMQLPHLAQLLMVMKIRQWCRWVGSGQRCGRNTGVGLTVA